MTYENNWESLNARPVPEWFADAKFGIFIHWGVYSVPAYTKKGDYAEWYMRQIENPDSEARKFHDRVYGKDFRYEDFAGMFKAELFDANQWADIIRRSGAKYMNLVSKHHDGFCMYKSDYAWNWNSVDIGPHRDFCMELKTALEGTGVRFGVYHSVYEWFHPLYLKDPEEYALKHLHPMLKELITKYEPATLFTDGEWDHESSVWHSTEFLQWLYNESPVKDYIVPNDRWGRETRGRLGGNFTTEYGIIDGGRKIEDIELDRPFEECRGIGRSFGLNRAEMTEDYLSAKELLTTLVDLVAKGGNFLLNIGPAADGTIPVIMEERLLQMGKWLAVNGDAIYGTRLYTKKPQKGTWYTKKGDTVYAIIDRFPFGSVTFDEIPYSDGLKARLLSHPAALTVENDGGKAKLAFPPIDPEEVTCEHLYAIEFTRDEPAIVIPDEVTETAESGEAVTEPARSPDPAEEAPPVSSVLMDRPAIPFPQQEPTFPFFETNPIPEPVADPVPAPAPAPVPVSAPAPAPETLPFRCPQCGTEPKSPTEKYCRNCGAPLR